MDIEYINEAGKSIKIYQRKPIFLTSIDGVSAVKNIVNTFKAPSQDGAVFVSSSLDMRHIVIEGRIVAENIEEAYVHRNRLLEIFNPKHKGRLIFRDCSINCIVDEAPIFKADSQRLPVFLISLLCPSPYFESIEEIKKELAQWHKLFSFELEIPIDDGIEFGRREDNLIIAVENTGAVSCGATFEFVAQGVVVNPAIIDVVTGKFLKLNRTMQAGESIIATTHFANKKVVSSLNGGTNAFASLNAASDFLQLEVGTNLLRYDAEKNLDNLEVSVYYRPQMLGV